MVSLVTIQRYYTVIDFVSHTVHSIPVTHFFVTGCLYLFISLTISLVSLPLSFLASACLFSVSVTITDLFSVSMTRFLFYFLIWFLYSTYK